MFLDLYFLLNLAVDYWLLLIMAKLLFRKPGALRLLAGAAVGAGAATAVACWPGSGLNGAVFLLVPVLMLWVVLRPLPWRGAIISWVTFFLISFLTGGAALAFQGLYMPSGGADRKASLAILAGACLILYLIPAGARPFLEEKKWQQRLKLKLLVKWQDRQKIIPALLDTGNRLREPLRQRPVILVDFHSVSEFLPPQVLRGLEDPGIESWEILQGLQEHQRACRFILIPFRGIGVKEQLMLGFCPQEATVFSEDRSWTLGSGAVLGLYRQGFGANAEYRALLPPELISQTEKWGDTVGSTFDQA